MSYKDSKKILKQLLSDDVNSIGSHFLNTTTHKEFNEIPDSEIPQSWKRIYYKIYPRFPQKFLKKLKTEKNSLFSIIKSRKSRRDFQSKSFTLKTISKILYFSCGVRDFRNVYKSFRMYPSAGARYPLEVYVIVLKSNEISSGIYHYNVKWNSLELLLKGNFREKVGQITGQSWTKESTIVVVITSVFSRTVIKYGERGWRYIFFEAGHLAQNIHLISSWLGTKSCAIGGFLDEEIIELLDLNRKSERPLYLISVGK